MSRGNRTSNRHPARSWGVWAGPVVMSGEPDLQEELRCKPPSSSHLPLKVSGRLPASELLPSFLGSSLPRVKALWLWRDRGRAAGRPIVLLSHGCKIAGNRGWDRAVPGEGAVRGGASRPCSERAEVRREPQQGARSSTPSSLPGAVHQPLGQDGVERPPQPRARSLGLQAE